MFGIEVAKGYRQIILESLAKEQRERGELETMFEDRSDQYRKALGIDSSVVSRLTELRSIGVYGPLLEIVVEGESVVLHTRRVCLSDASRCLWRDVLEARCVTDTSRNKSSGGGTRAVSVLDDELHAVVLADLKANA